MATAISRVLELTEALMTQDICTQSLTESSKGQAIAKEIVKQLRATNKWAMASWGANQLIALDDGLQFKAKGSKLKVGGRVQIRLNSLDLYDVRVFRVSGTKITEVANAESLYADALVDILDAFIG